MSGTPKNFAELVGVFLDIFSLIIPLIFSLSLLVIVWKIIDTWILNAGDTAKIESGKNFVLFGLIALVVMVGIWGILAILRRSFFGF